MKALYEDVNARKGNQSFVAYQYTIPFFEFKWHYHPEYELTLITQGKGQRIVGDSYQNFECNELILIGPDMPHTWVSDENSQTEFSATVIQFSKDLVEPWLKLEEFSAVNKMLQSSKLGLCFPSNEIKSLLFNVLQLPQETGVKKITLLFELLNEMSECNSLRLASPFYQPLNGVENEKRINKVCSYLQQHYNQAISLSEMAEMINLTDSGFCKFFKRALGKTYSDYVNDLRINHALILLRESDKSIAEIAYQSGFESITYFNRVFMKKKKMTPKVFRNNKNG